MSTVHDAHVQMFRDRWASRFTDTATISKTTDAGTFNESTGLYEGPTTIEKYAGGVLCRPKGERLPEFAESVHLVSSHVVYLPHTATGIEPLDVVTMATSEDPDLVGVPLIVRGVGSDTYLTRRSLMVEYDRGNG